MKQVGKLEKINNLSYFDIETLNQVINVSRNSLYANIKRWIKAGRIIQLKKGLYVTNQYLNQVRNKQIYLEFLANKLKSPSYLSLQYVLQKYDILSESVFGLTSITLQKPKDYTNSLAVFSYRSIRRGLYCGYKIISADGFTIREATKAKALFDYLYLKLIRADFRDINLLDSFRLKLDEFTNQEKKEFTRYCREANVKKYQELPQLLFNL